MSIAVQLRYSVEAGLLLLGVVVLIGPLIAERLRIPGLIGLIAAGTVLGPHALSWLQPGGFVATLGAAGLLYLMFVAGIELDLRAFASNRRAAVTFGVLTFAVPFALSWFVGRYALGLGVSATALVGAMWASHTLLAYPEVKAAGIDRGRAVGVTLAATVITDVVALVILAVAASSTALEEAPEVAAELASGTLETSTVAPLWVGLVLLLVVCFGVIPRATKWLFSNLLLRRSERFVWALVAMSAGAIAGVVGGVEGMVGAFLAGIGMNSAVPARSELMERIEFIGSALLIPAFLVAVGLSIDPLALADPETLAIAAAFTGIVLVGKTVAAVVTGALCGLERDEVGVMTSLSIGQAAATLAIAQVGVTTGLLDDQIRDAAVVTVVVTVILTSFGTRLASRRLSGAFASTARMGDHVLVLAPLDDVPVATYASLVSAMLRDDGGVVTPFAVRTRAAAADVTTDRLAALDAALVRMGHDTRPVHRVAATQANGIPQLAEELDATLLVVPIARERMREALGSARVALAPAVSTAIPVVAVVAADVPWRRVVLLPGNPSDDPERGRERLVATEVAARLAAGRSTALVVPVVPDDVAAAPATSAIVGDPGDLARVAEQLRPGDVLVVPAGLLADASVDDRNGLRRASAGASVVIVGAARPARRRRPHVSIAPSVGDEVVALI